MSLTTLAAAAETPSLPNAACRGVDPAPFFADRTNQRRLDQARAICHRCPEIRHCLAWALEHREHGVWAGTTEDQRADLIARHGRPTST